MSLIPSRRSLTAIPDRVARLVTHGHVRVSDDELRAGVEGKTVLLTGASFGIGEATARRLVDAGATALLVARTEDRLRELTDELNAGDADGTAVALPLDLTDFDAVGALAESVIAEYGAPDVLVNNAGRSIHRSIAESRFHDFQRTIDINYLAPVRLTLGLLPAMRERGSGHLVNTSTWGVYGMPIAPAWSAYLSSKAAFDTWVRCVAQEVRSEGITATTVHMGLVRTRMASSAVTKGMPAMTPDEAAHIMCQAIVKKPRIAGPWWLGPADLVTNQVFRGPTDAVHSRVFAESEKRNWGMGGYPG
ncbi:MAG: SDR family NAD(P)-dependent oxidoreductase [Solirubrobacteraceae bacterium]|nr:SDR family NAD(P)-dependent oxidoreductase [Solirubrobacteraceae bacterium]